VNGIRKAVGTAGGEPSLALALSLGMTCWAREHSELYGRLQVAIHAEPWLREPYVPRPDPEGEIWMRARLETQAG
jgi:hypothetical protein